MKSLPILLSLTLLAASPLIAQEKAAPLSSQEATSLLKMGDAAPAYEPGAWVQGEEVKAFDKDHAYLIECWATWCGPCIGNIPHVNELHEAFKDKGLVVIGQNLWERDAAKVPEIAKQMKYRVVRDSVDGNEGNIATKWMKAAGRNGIPSAFLVGKDGKLAWIGHPGQLTPEIITDVLAGSYDIVKAGKKMAADELERTAKQEKVGAAAKRRIAAMKAKDWKAAEAAIEEIAGLGMPTTTAMRVELATAKKDDAGLEKLLTEAVKEHAEDPMWRHYLATNIISAEPSPAAIAAAEKLSKEGGAAAEESAKNLFSFLDARILQIKGDISGATKLMETVVAGETVPQRKAYFENLLKKMKADSEKKPEASQSLKAAE